MSEMNAVLQAILDLSNKMDRLESRMGMLKDRISSLEERVSSLEEQSNKNQLIMIEKLDRINEHLSHDSLTSKGEKNSIPVL